MLLPPNHFADHFFSISWPARLTLLLLLGFCLGINGTLRAKIVNLQTCESHLQSFAYQEAFACLQANRPVQLKPEDEYSQQWLVLWLSYHLQIRDSHQAPKEELSQAISLAQNWMRTEESSIAQKQQLAYLVYLYFNSFGSDQSSQSSLSVSNLQTDQKHASLLANAFLIFLLFSLFIVSGIFAWDTYRRKPANTSLSKAFPSQKKERHQSLLQQYTQLQDYSIANSHLVRAPLARMLGLVELLQDEPLTADGQFYLQNLTQSCTELDQWISNMNDILEQKDATRENQQVVEELSHFLSREK